MWNVECGILTTYNFQSHKGRNTFISYQGVTKHRTGCTGSTPAPKMVYFEYWNKTVFVALLVTCGERWHTDSQQCSELRPQTAPVKATGGRQRLPRLRSAIADYAANACITGINWLNTSIQSFFIADRPILGADAELICPMRCFVTPIVLYQCRRCRLWSLKPSSLWNTSVMPCGCWYE